MPVARFRSRTTPKVAPRATSSSALQNISASTAGSASTTAHFAPKRASNGSIRVWNSSARMRRAKNTPPMIRLMPKQTPPCKPLARLVR
jgi:hypothetical protein